MGPVAQDLEFWVEQQVGFMTHTSHTRSTSMPAGVYVNHLLLDRALRLMRAKLGLKTFDELFPNAR